MTKQEKEHADLTARAAKRKTQLEASLGQERLAALEAHDRLHAKLFASPLPGLRKT
jgi:hypothetical protein